MALILRKNEPTIYRVPDRTIEHRPAKSTRRWFHNDIGLVGIQPHPESLERLDEDLPEYVRKSFIIFLQEHCIFTENDRLWEKIQKNKFNEAVNIATKKVCSFKKKTHELYAVSGGNTAKTAALIVAEYWDVAVQEFCNTIGLSGVYEKLTSKIRPSGGMPMYDEAMRTLAELMERGDWE